MRLLLTSGRLLVGAAAVVLPLAFGCNVSPTGMPPMLFNHCGDLAGDATCYASHPGRPFCDLCRSASESQGCAASPPAVPACRPDPGVSITSADTGDDEGEDTSSSTAEPSTTSSTGSSSDSTTGTPLACVSADGTFDEQCNEVDPAAPYCVDEACVGCEAAGADEFCAELDPLTPACDLEAQVCTGCDAIEDYACPAETPVCDESGECVACSSHGDCPSTACHLDESDPLFGQCFLEDERIWVDNSVVCPGMGTEASPNCSLTTVLAGVQDDQNWVIFVAGGTPYAENPVLAADAAVALLGQGTPTISGETDVDAPSLHVDRGTAYVDAMRFNDNTQTHGVRCDDGVLWLQGSEVSGNEDYAVFTGAPCTVVAQRSTVFGNDGGGFRQLGGLLRVDNTSIGHNGDGQRGPAINLQFAELDMVYATLAGNDATQHDNLLCLDALGTVRNSILVGVDSGSVELDCFMIEFDRNAVDTIGFTGAEGTLVTDSYNPLWFSAPDSGNFQLAAPPLTPFGNVAVWEPGDPPLDADGTERPQGGGAAYAGVDEPG